MAKTQMRSLACLAVWSVPLTALGHDPFSGAGEGLTSGLAATLGFCLLCLVLYAVVRIPIVRALALGALVLSFLASVVASALGLFVFSQHEIAFHILLIVQVGVFLAIVVLLCRFMVLRE